MYQDEVILDVWKNRDAYARRHDNDLHKMVEDLKKRQEITPEHFVDRRAHVTIIQATK